MKKKILLGLLVIAALAAGTGFYLYNKPAEKVVSGDAAFVIEAPALFSEYEANEAEANNEMFGVSCQVSGTEGTAQLKEGDIVAVKGLCTGLLMDVVLVKCSVEKIGN